MIIVTIHMYFMPIQFCVNHSDTTTVYSNCNDGDVRLVGGDGDYEGRVETCMNQAWGTICDTGWNQREAKVVCIQLGFLPLGTVQYVSGHIY